MLLFSRNTLFKEQVLQNEILHSTAHFKTKPCNEKYWYEWWMKWRSKTNKVVFFAVVTHEISLLW